MIKRRTERYAETKDVCECCPIRTLSLDLTVRERRNGPHLRHCFRSLGAISRCLNERMLLASLTIKCPECGGVFDAMGGRKPISTFPGGGSPTWHTLGPMPSKRALLQGRLGTMRTEYSQENAAIGMLSLYVLKP